MTNETSAKEQHREYLMNMPKEQLVELMFTHLRNMWSVDGLYFIGIEDMFGTKPATEIDAYVWEVMGKIEAKRLRQVFDIQGTDLESMIKLMKASGWFLDLEHVELDVNGNKAIIRNTNCRVQNTRNKKGLGEFPCKQVRFGFLKSFFGELNPNTEVKCVQCPPDPHTDVLWCEWHIRLK